MRGINQLVFTGALLVSVFLTASQAIAQDAQGTGSQPESNDQGGRRQRVGGFDRAQYRQRMMDLDREKLEVTDDAEWKALQPLIAKVIDARTALRAAERGALAREGQSGGGGNQADPVQGRNPGAANPAAERLQKAVDAKAPASEIKAALAKYLEYRKGRRADLEKAQEALRAVLTSRQEAIAVLLGLL